MKHRLRNIIFSAAMAIAAIAPFAVSARNWEPIRTERTDVKLITKDSETEIKATHGVIQVTVSRPQTIRVYTILGRQVSVENVQPGTSQFLIRNHGVYIVKVGELTAKVAA